MKTTYINLMIATNCLMVQSQDLTGVCGMCLYVLKSMLGSKRISMNGSFKYSKYSSLKAA